MQRITKPLTFAVSLAAPAVVMAQTPTNVPNESSGLWQWGVAVGLAVIVLLTGFLNPKRSHLT